MRRGKQKAKRAIYNVHTLLIDLKACSIKKDLPWGRRIHVKAMDGQNVCSNVATAFVKMYAKCGSMVDARLVFDSMHKPDVVSWTTLLLGYADTGEGQVTLDLFSIMNVHGCAPDSVTYVAALKACTSLALNGDENGRKKFLQRGREIHSTIGRHLDNHVRTTLINMYAKCGSTRDARCVFDSMENPEVSSCNALIMGYAENGEGHQALELFSLMKIRQCVPDSITYVAALKACTSLALNGDSTQKADCLELGRQIHLEIRCHVTNKVHNTLIDMYSKCGSMVEARGVFDSMKTKDVVSWNALLSGYAENGKGQFALDLFSRMKACGYVPNSVTYVAALKACTCLARNGDDTEKETFLERGRRIHLEIGCHLNCYVKNSLIDMYSNCRSMKDAHCVFESMQNPDVVSWTALLLGYAESGQGHVSLNLFSKMKVRGCVPDSVTYMAAVKSITSLALNEDESGKKVLLERGKVLHSEMGCHLRQHVKTTLMDMYAKCGSMVDAHCVFDSIQKPDVVSWNALLLGYAENGEGNITLDLFSKMKVHGYVLDSVTYLAALKACTTLAMNRNDNEKRYFLERGRDIHSDIRCHFNHYLYNTIIDMYAKCGSMVEARRVFDSMQKPDVVSWNGLLLGYADSGEGHVTLDLFSKMKACGYTPNAVTYVAALKACAVTGSIMLGRKFHGEISNFTTHIVTCLVDLYAKCGRIVEAHNVFDSHSKLRDVTTWTALLAGYGDLGDSHSVFKLFDGMRDEGLRPDAVTFVCMLLCCSHAGFVEKAREYLIEMPVKYGVTPTVVHYNCMVDALGRANQMNEAVAVIRKMPCNPDAVTWLTLLAACRKWKNVEIGKGAFQALVDMDKDNGPGYVLMAHIYGSRGMWEEQERILRVKFGTMVLNINKNLE